MRWLGGLAVGVAVLLLLAGPIHQSPDYHEFADGRTLLGLPNSAAAVGFVPDLASVPPSIR